MKWYMRHSQYEAHHMINSQKWSAIIVAVGYNIVLPNVTSNLTLSIYLKPINASSVIILKFQKYILLLNIYPKYFSLKSVFWVLFFFWSTFTIFFLPFYFTSLYTMKLSSHLWFCSLISLHGKANLFPSNLPITVTRKF